MQYSLALAAIAASVLVNAQLPTNPQALQSVLSVLETDLPSATIAEAASNQAAFSSLVASELKAGSTPAWFAALPTDIQTLLQPVSGAPASASAAASSNVAALTSLASGISSSGVPVNSANSSIPFRASTATLRPTTTSGLGSSPSSGSGSGSTSSSSSSSSGAASVPTAVMGMGIAGVVGLVGVLAL